MQDKARVYVSGHWYLIPSLRAPLLKPTLPFHHWNFCTTFFYVRVLLSSVFLTQVTVFLLGAMDIHCAVFSDKIQHSKATLEKPILVQGPEDLLTFTATFRQTSPLNVVLIINVEGGNEPRARRSVCVPFMYLSVKYALNRGLSAVHQALCKHWGHGIEHGEHGLCCQWSSESSRECRISVGFLQANVTLGDPGGCGST